MIVRAGRTEEKASLVVHVADPRTVHTVALAVPGRVHLAEAMAAAAVLALFAATVAFVSVRYRDRGGRAAPSGSRRNALEVSVALGVMAFVVWLSVFIASADSKRAQARAVSVVPVGRNVSSPVDSVAPQAADTRDRPVP